MIVLMYKWLKNAVFRRPPMNVARWGHAAAAMGGRIYVVGGCTDTNMAVCENPVRSSDFPYVCPEPVLAK
jgi:hypothetical protein|eukprot:COSAG06_NODE_1132_length_10582_cov_5.539826_13_plen_70_part_00